MDTDKKTIVLINGSPRMTTQSASGALLSRARKILEGDNLDIRSIRVRDSMNGDRLEADYEAMLHADALVVIFPLYIFCMPGLLTRYLQDYLQYVRSHPNPSARTRVYAIINCGFPEADINEEAVRVIRSFAEKIQASFEFGVMIGGGPMILQAADAPFMRTTTEKLDASIATIKEQLFTDSKTDDAFIPIEARFPRWLYFLFGDRSWISGARKNGLKKKDLFKKPYRGQ